MYRGRCRGRCKNTVGLHVLCFKKRFLKFDFFLREMQSDCVFTTSPTPSPTHPLSVPYTSPTSPTNTPTFFEHFAFCVICPMLVVSESDRAQCRSVHACSRGNLQFVLSHRMAHDRRCQCITIKSESVPSEKNVPSILATSPPHTPADAKLVASRAEVGTGVPLRNNRSIFV